MKIALFDYQFEGSQPGQTGLSDIVWSWAKYLLKAGHEVHIVAPYPEGTVTPEGSILHSFPLPPIGYRNIVGQTLIVLKGLTIVRNIPGIQVIQSPEYHSTAFFSVFLKTPVVMLTPGNIFERIHNVNTMDWSVTQVYKVSALISARRCAKIIATSDEMAYWWKYSGAQDDQIVVLPLGVDTDLFHAIPNARQQLGIDDSPNILFIGRFHRENGLENLIRALPYVREVVPNAKLDVVGYGKEEEELRALATDLGVIDMIRWHGYIPREQLPLYYSASLLLSMPRLSRVTPRVLLEAMACGLPVIASNVGGVGEFIIPGETGYTTDPNDSHKIAEYVISLFHDQALLLQMKTNVVRYVHEHIAWDLIVEQMSRTIYDPILQSQAGILERKTKS